MTKPYVYVTRPVQEDGVTLLKTRCEVQIGTSEELAKEEFHQSLEKAFGVVVIDKKIDVETCEKIKDHCYILANYGVGYDSIDVEAATKAGILVTYNPGVVTDDTADLAMGLLLAVARRIPESDLFVRAGEKDWRTLNLFGTKVSGKTLGIVGSGRIAQAMARRAQGFDLKILYTSRNQNREFEEKCGATYVSKEELLSQSDFISLHIPGGSGTHHYLSEKEFHLMKKTAFLINTARGTVIDEKALVRALQTRQIAGAGLDVFEREPEVEAELLEMKNVVLNPHSGTRTLETRNQMLENCSRAIFAVMDGQIPVNCLNPEALENRKNN